MKALQAVPVGQEGAASSQMGRHTPVVFPAVITQLKPAAHPEHVPSPVHP